MIAKCNFCGNSFDAQRKTARFCSDLHRTLFGKLSPEEKIEKLKQYGLVTTADKVKSFSNGGTILDQINIDNKKDEWVREVEDYCSNEGITPEDLILSHKERNKPQKNKKGSNSSKEVENSEKSNVINNSGYSKFNFDRRKAKCGF